MKFIEINKPTDKEYSLEECITILEPNGCIWHTKIRGISKNTLIVDAYNCFSN